MITVTGPGEFEGDLIHTAIFWVRDGDVSFRVTFRFAKDTKIQRWHIQRPPRATVETEHTVEMLLGQDLVLASGNVVPPAQPTTQLAERLYRAWVATIHPGVMAVLRAESSIRIIWWKDGQKETIKIGWPWCVDGQSGAMRFGDMNGNTGFPLIPVENVISAVAESVSP